MAITTPKNLTKKRHKIFPFWPPNQNFWLTPVGKRTKIWANNLIRFGQNQNLASQKTLDLLRLWLDACLRTCCGVFDCFKDVLFDFENSENQTTYPYKNNQIRRILSNMHPTKMRLQMFNPGLCGYLYLSRDL